VNFERQSDAELWLDPETVILPSKGRLHILNRRGLTKLQADHIDEVHEKLKPYLDGTYQESELIAAVAAEKQSILEKYFAAMNQSGALRRGKPAPEHTGITIEEAGRGLLARVYGKIAYVSLYGEEPIASTGNHPYDAWLLFVTPDQMRNQWKRIWRARRNGPHLLYVIEKGEPGGALSAADMEARKQYATWLLGCSRMDSWESRAIRLYSLEKAGSVLTPLFQASLGSTAGGDKITPDLVTVTDHDQIPLAIAKAAVPFYSNSVAGCGVEYGLLSDEVAREFIVQATLASAVKTGELACVAEFRRWERTKVELRRTRVQQKQASSWPVAGSLLELRLRALERFLWELPVSYRGGSREIDVLRTGDRNPQIAYLANVLRTRLSTLPMKAQATTCGLYVCQAENYQAFSLIEAKAIRDVLLSAAKNEFYRESLREVGTQHECDFTTFLSEDELWQIALQQDAMLDERRVNRKFIFKHVQRYGISAWVGTLGQGN